MPSTTLTTPIKAPAHTSVRRPAALAVALSIVLTVVLIVRDTDSGPAWRVGLVLAAAIAVTAAVVFGLVVRRTLAKADPRSSAKTALTLGILAVVSFIVFWMAVSPILGVGALLLARDARDRRPFRGERMATVGGILGAIGTVAALAMSFIG
jgi:hypothetical protein